MAKIYIMAQGKGGVGKSFIAGLLAQYFLEKGRPALCFDADPNNASFAAFPAYNAVRVKLSEVGDDINPRHFDVLWEKLYQAGEEDMIILDIGASSFLPFCAYLKENNAIALLREAGHDVVLQSVLAGGPMFGECLMGLAELFSHFETVPVVVWLNPFGGKCEFEGQAFQDSALYLEQHPRIRAVVSLPAEKQATTGYDIAQVQLAHLTFREAIEAEGINLMARQRLTQAWRKISGLIELARL